MVFNAVFHRRQATDEELLIGKLDWHITAPATLLYFLSFLDRTNVAYAAIEGLKTDLQLDDSQYRTGLSIFFAGYIINEFPSVWALKKLTARIWLPWLTILWGSVALLNGFTFSAPSYYAARFFLGISEGGLFPGIIYVISLYYKCSEQPLRIAFFFSGASFAGTFGGLFAYGISQIPDMGWQGLQGSFHSWRWIYIIEGLVTIVLGIWAFRFIPKDPLAADFLKTPEEQQMLRTRMSNGEITDSEDFEWKGVKAAFLDPKCYLYGLVLHFLDLPQYTIALFLPSIIKTMGFSDAKAQALTVPPYFLAAITTITTAKLTQHYRCRTPFIIIPAAVGIIGYVILLAVPTSQSPGVAYLGTFLVLAGVFPACAIVLSWPASNVSGKTKRATACAGQIFIGFLGAVIGTQVYRNDSDSATSYVFGHAVACCYLAMSIIATMAVWLVLSRENERRAREMYGRGAELFDHGIPWDNAARDGDIHVDDVEPWRRDEGMKWTFQI